MSEADVMREVRRGEKSDTGIDQGYFNSITNATTYSNVALVVMPEKYGYTPDQVITMIRESIAKFRIYTDHLQWKIDRALRGREGSDINISVEELINDTNREAIKALDEIGLKIKAFENFELSDFDELLKLAIEAGVLIYGEENRETLEKRFSIEEEVRSSCGERGYREYLQKQSVVEGGGDV